MKQRTDEWFAARLGKVTASRINDVIAKTAKGAYTSARQSYMDELVAERLTGVVANKFVNAAMQWGTEMEPRAREFYQMKTGLFVEEVGFVPHYSLPHSGASPDGYVSDDGLIEIKCLTTPNHLDILVSDAVPEKYFGQIHWQMACTGRLWTDFVSYDPRLSDDLCMSRIRVSRDEGAIDSITEEVRKFLGEINERLARINARRTK